MLLSLEFDILQSVAKYLIWLNGHFKFREYLTILSHVSPFIESKIAIS